MGFIHLHLRMYLSCLAMRHGKLLARRLNQIARLVVELKHGLAREALVRQVAYMQVQIHFGPVFQHVIVGYKQSTTGRLVFVVGVGNENPVVSHHPAVAIDAAEVGKIEHVLRFARRIGGVVAVVGPYG